MSDDGLEELMRVVRSSARYRVIHESVVRRIAAQELSKRRSLKEAIKATRSKLHQVGGAYRQQQISYAHWCEKLAAVGQSPNDPALQDFCRQMMACHASTRERLPFVETFFTTTLQAISPLRSVLDLGCGLNPLAIPWMPLADGARYDACDIYEDLTGFMKQFLSHIRQPGEVECCDLVQTCPSRPAHVALLLKMLPCLEQQDKGIAARLLQSIPAEHILISFPVRSLSGISKGMEKHYQTHLMAILEGQNWKVSRHLFASELAFLISR
ncbi:MAG: 16S rRNA methyltransferase [Anaerolineae bacterium]|nr:16S rRNA methyltransferase [Anaerolineae bacterium]